MNRPDAAPLVSVIVPNFNHAPFLAERLRSILDQTVQDFELIVLDDASDDDSLRVLRELLHDQPHRLLSNAVNSGQPCAQWLKGLALAKGRYLWIAESDDSCSPTFLETLLPRLEQGSVLACCRTSSIDARGDLTPSQTFWPDAIDPERWHTSFRLDGKELCRAYMGRGNIIANASAAVFRKPDEAIRRVLEKVTANRRYCGDWLFWTHYLMRMSGSLWFESEVLSQFRSHDGTTRSSAPRSQERQRFGEYSSAISAVLRCTRPRPRGEWLAIATAGGWDWIIYEYLWRYRPSLAEKLLLPIVRGPLRHGFYARLLQSAPLRRRYLSWPSG